MFDRIKGWPGRVRAALRRTRPSPYGIEAERRVAVTLRCRDSDPIPKVPRAGEVIDHDGRRVQVMHDGTLVLAGGYHGDWMAEIIRGLRGHHEPQEELAFHHLVHRCRPGTVIVEVGAFWAYYTNWYLGAVAGSTAVCVEPDANNIACGQRNLAINGRSATWVNACVGRDHAAATTIRRESDGATVSVPCHSMDSLLDMIAGRPVEMLHVDCQGAELPFLDSLGPAVQAGLLRFVVVSTHHATISGSRTTHQDCLQRLEGLGAAILCEHSVEESFSGDGLIAASFSAADSDIELPAISRNMPRESLFGPDGDEPGDRRFVLAETDNGPMLVFEHDAYIGRNLRELRTGDEGEVANVVRFLRRRHGFRPHLFLHVEANIGTHLLRALRDGTFQQAVGIEPDADNYRLLSANVLLNGCQDRARLFNIAASDVAGSAIMEISGDNPGDHRIQAVNATGPAPRRLPSTRSSPRTSRAGSSGATRRSVPCRATSRRNSAGISSAASSASHFGRALCTGCGQGVVVAFSCKGRGVCPSCNGRHMAQTAAHLVDHVIPPVPVRQWVISVPKRLRGFLADRPEAVRALTKIFLDDIERLLSAAAGVTTCANTPTTARPRLGAVSFLHRFGSALNHHVHLHVCATDGVFVPAADGAGCDASPAFLPARPITQVHLATVTERIRHRVTRWFSLAHLLDASAAADMLAWENSGFSIDAFRPHRDDRPRRAELFSELGTPAAVLRPATLCARATLCEPRCRRPDRSHSLRAAET